MSSYIGMIDKAPRRERFSLEAIAKLLTTYLECSWNLCDINTRLPEGDQVSASSMVSCADNYLYTDFCDLKMGIVVNDLTNDSLIVWLEKLLAVSSKDLGWKLQKLFVEIKYEYWMVNPTSRIIELWSQWNATKTKYGLEYVLEDPKGKKEWRRLMIS